MTNFEFKAHLHDMQHVKAALLTRAANFAGVLQQTDTYFHVSGGRLKLREIVYESQTAPAPQRAESQLIFYQRPDHAAVKRSDYHIAPIGDAVTLREVLALALGVRVIVKKRRTLYLLPMKNGGNIRIHLDQVEGLGDFVEVEAVAPADEFSAAAEAEAQDLLQAFHITENELISGSYADLLLATPSGQRLA